MKVFVVDSFIRDDKNLEHSSGVIDVFSNLDAAIKCAKVEAMNNIDYYMNIKIDELEDTEKTKFYCCLDKDPSDEAEYPQYMVITVTEHELKEN